MYSVPSINLYFVTNSLKLEIDDIVSFRLSCRGFARIGITPMWADCLVRLGHHEEGTGDEHQVCLASDTADLLQHVRKLALYSLPNVTESDMEQTLSLVFTNLDAPRLQDLLFTHQISLRKSAYKRIGVLIELASNIRQIILPRAHREFQEDAESHDHFSRLGLHARTQDGKHLFLRRSADLDMALKLASRWRIAEDRLALFGSANDHASTVSRSLNNILARVFPGPPVPLCLKHLILTDVRMQHLSAYVSFPALEILELMYCYDVQDFLGTLTLDNLRLTKFLWVKYTLFADTETKDGSLITRLIGSLHCLQHLCIQIPPQMQIKYRGTEGLVENLHQGLRTVYLRVEQFPDDCLDAIMAKLRAVVSLGVQSDVMSKSVSKISKESSMWFMRDMKALAVS